MSMSKIPILFRLFILILIHLHLFFCSNCFWQIKKQVRAFTPLFEATSSVRHPPTPASVSTFSDEYSPPSLAIFLEYFKFIDAQLLEMEKDKDKSRGQVSTYRFKHPAFSVSFFHLCLAQYVITKPNRQTVLLLILLLVGISCAADLHKGG